MEWKLDAKEMEDYGKAIPDLMMHDIPCDLRREKDGSGHLAIPDEAFREFFRKGYEANPALQAYYEKDAFLTDALDSIRKNLKEGLEYIGTVADKAKERYGRDQAYQAFCQIPGVTEDEKKKAKELIEDGCRRDGYTSIAPMLVDSDLSGFSVVLTDQYPNRNVSLPFENPCEEAFDAMHSDLCKMKALREDLDRVQASFFLRDPKADTRACLGAWLHTARLMQEPDYDTILGNTKIPEVAGFHRRQTDALYACITELGKLGRETDAILRDGEKTDALREEDGRAFFLKACDIIANYNDKCGIVALEYSRPNHDAPIPFNLTPDPDRIRDCQWADAGTKELDSLRGRPGTMEGPEKSGETLAEEAMRKVYRENPDNFDYEALDRMAAKAIIERGGEEEDLRDLAELAAIIRPNIGETDLYAYKVIEPETATEHPVWTITEIAYAPDEGGLLVEAYNPDGECVHLAQQLHQCKDGTDRLPESYDNDIGDCWSGIEKDGRDALNPREVDCCRFLGATTGHGTEAFRNLLDRAMGMVADEDRCIPRREALLYREPRQDYVIVSLDPESTPTGKPHEIHLTKEDFAALDKEKSFLKGCTSHTISVNKDEVIRRDTLRPETAGKHLTDAYPDFYGRAYTLKAVQKAMKKHQTGR